MTINSPHTSTTHTNTIHASKTVSRLQQMALGFVALMLAATTLISFTAPASATERTRVEERTKTEKVVMQVATVKTDSLAIATPVGGGGTPEGPDEYIFCVAPTSPVAFDMPIYDDDGLFVVGYETVWFCIDTTLPPAG